MSKRSRGPSLSPSSLLSSSSESHHSLGSWMPDRNGVDENRSTKLVAVDSFSVVGRTAMKCTLPPHDSTVEFPTIEAFEIHYSQEHTNRCSSCGKNFPSAHYLALHIDENHNPMREAQAAKGEKTFGCFLPDCDRKCSTPQKRRLHVIDKHNFPKFYNFRIVDYGIDNATSMLREGRKRRISTSVDPLPGHQRKASDMTHTPAGNSIRLENLEHATSINKPHVQADKEDGKAISIKVSNSSFSDKQATKNDAMQDLETSFAGLHFVPRSIATRQRPGEAQDPPVS